MLLNLLAFSGIASSQTVTSSLSFSAAGSFTNSVAESGSSLLIADNNLTNGYASGFDLTDAPASLAPSGPSGSAAFQWGNASTTSSYPHASALWFEPVSVNAVQPETFFTIGYLYYRNGTIVSNTGASGVNLNLALNFTNPSGISTQNTTFAQQLVNTPNTSDPVASADIVTLPNTASELTLTDASGRHYYLQMSFQVDQTTIDGTLSTPTQFKVFEGKQGSATLLGRFTTDPTPIVPEPSSALIAAVASISFFRRRRAA
jgi:hypothetical protein